MKKFLSKVSLYVLLVLLLHVVALHFADGNTDLFYMRVATPKQKSMIVGTSTSAQGILPAVLKEETGQDFFNFSFTLFHSPYGPVYFEAIKKKLLPGISEGATFLVSVDPWSVSSRLENPNDTAHFRENDLFLNNIRSVSSNPNFGYAYGNFDRAWGDIIIQHLVFGRGKGQMFLHDDGWLEINVNMNDKATEKRISSKMEEYRKHLKRFNFSTVRYDYLRKLIEYLNTKGEVILLRMPMSESFQALSLQLMPEFEDKLKSLTEETKTRLLDFSNMNDYRFTDGVHLYKDDARAFSVILSDSLKAINQN